MQSAPLSEVVKEARAKAGLTQAEVSVRSGVSLTVVRNIEQGITKDPRYGTVLAILDAIRGHEQEATERVAEAPLNDTRPATTASRR